MMNKTFSIIYLFFALTLSAYSVNHTINVVGFTYSPNFLVADIGDSVTIMASTTHPAVQVDMATWYADGSDPINGGWLVQTSTFTFVPLKVDTIYFVCQNHVSIGMKGKIAVVNPNSIFEAGITQSDFSIYPNPLSSKGEISFNNKESGSLTIRIFDNLGRKIRTIFAEDISGTNSFSFDVSDMDNGVYFVIFTLNEKEYYQKIVVLR